MCISLYLNEGSRQYIDALERLQLKTRTKYQDTFSDGLELERTIDEYIIKERRRQARGLEIIASVSDPTARDLLLYRYRDALPWQTITEIMLYSERQVLRLHKKALEQFDAAELIAV